jgi:hypothetical protein
MTRTGPDDGTDPGHLSNPAVVGFASLAEQERKLQPFPRYAVPGSAFRRSLRH